MRVEVCTTFLFSRDGFNSERLDAGAVTDIPDHMVKGLIFEGYVKPYVEEKALGEAEENKALFAAPENKNEGAAVFSVPQDEMVPGDATFAPRKKRK